MIIDGEKCEMTSPAPRIDFDADDYTLLHSLVFRGDYPGYKPTVTEIPNGDGKADADKRYAHVALKYLPGWGTSAERQFLIGFLYAAHLVAEAVADAMGVPAPFRPDIRYGALRVLEYPPGAVSHEHTDFDLFTLALYRDRPECFQRSIDHRAFSFDQADAFSRACELNTGLHLGELGEAIGLGPATLHSVTASPETQHSIVYFAIPDHDAILPPHDGGPLGFRVSNCSVRSWLNERMARSRTAFTPYRKEGA